VIALGAADDAVHHRTASREYWPEADSADSITAPAPS